MSVFARRAASARDVLWAHPEWWVVALGAIAWVPFARHGLQAMTHTHGGGPSVAGELGRWHVMVLAMMVPILALKARDVAFRSLPERRHRAILLFLIGYFVPWSIAGVPAAIVHALLPAHAPWTAGAAFAAAAGWVLFPVRERAMVMSYGHEPAIAPEGLEADRDCFLAGTVVGSWCVLSCWPLMLACAISGHHLFAAGAGALLGIVDRRSFRPQKRAALIVCTSLAVWFGIVAVR